MAAKRMSDDEIANFVYGKLMGDLDGIEAHSLFSEDGEKELEGAVPNAEPQNAGSGGVKITVEPIMAAAQEGGKLTDKSEGDDDEDEDRLKGIGGMSPLMAQLHGGR